MPSMSHTEVIIGLLLILMIVAWWRSHKLAFFWAATIG